MTRRTDDRTRAGKGRPRTDDRTPAGKGRRRTDERTRAGKGRPRLPGWFQYAVKHRAERCLIGDVGVRLHDNKMQADLGFTLAAEWQGRGYASEAVRTVLDDLFRRGLRRVSAECDARNERSARLLERVGFRREGYRPANTWLKGEWTDDILFGLLASKWRT